MSGNEKLEMSASIFDCKTMFLLSYYCKSGEKTGLSRECPVGQVCPEGVATPEYCPDGKMTYSLRQHECVDCNEG